MIDTHGPCEFLIWDSDHFGHRIARVTGHRLSQVSMADICDWCSDQKIECLYFLADAEHDETVVLAENGGFHLVDVRVTFGIRLIEAIVAAAPGPDHIQDLLLRTAKLSDVDRLEAIAQTAHEQTRFYFDHHFSKGQCSNLYATWIRRSVGGFADHVFVAEHSGQIAGYITGLCAHNATRQGDIGLIGVDSCARGKGIGMALIRRSLLWFAAQGIQEVRVVTQGRNVAAQRLFQRAGFVTHSTRLWYHKWFTVQ